MQDMHFDSGSISSIRNVMKKYDEFVVSIKDGSKTLYVLSCIELSDAEHYVKSQGLEKLATIYQIKGNNIGVVYEPPGLCDTCEKPLEGEELKLRTPTSGARPRIRGTCDTCQEEFLKNRIIHDEFNRTYPESLYKRQSPHTPTEEEKAYGEKRLKELRAKWIAEGQDEPWH
jgi:hypothetical protein